MAREHVDFIDTGSVDERPVAEGPFAGTAERLLSRDDESGARTARAAWPAGWSGDLASPTDLVELYVLDGALAVDGTPAPRGAFVRIEAGAPPSRVAAEEASEVLVMVEPRPGRGEVTVIDAERQPWLGESWRGSLPGFALKPLWTDHERGPMTLLVGNVPRFETGPEFHECPEELYVVEGDWTGRRGTMTKGSYFWRPEYVTHGPYRCETGALCLVRGHGHILANWIDDADATPEQNRAYAATLR